MNREELSRSLNSVRNQAIAGKTRIFGGPVLPLLTALCQNAAELSRKSSRLSRTGPDHSGEPYGA